MTSYEEVYSRFLGKVDDYDLKKLLEVDEESFRSLLKGYLEESIINFPQCEKDLEEVEERIEEGNTIATQYFTSTLTLEEKEILSKGMVLAWLSPKVMFAENMEKSIGDRDYKAVQGYQYVQQLNTLRKNVEEEIRRYSVMYTYNHGKMNLEEW